ncbi:hypothetical protein ACF05F_33950 [Rhodococcus erythropolis]
MWDHVELWLRKAGGMLLLGVLMLERAFSHESWWLPLRGFLALAGLSAIAVCLHETWKMIRSRETAKEELDRLEAAHRGDTT